MTITVETSPEESPATEPEPGTPATRKPRHRHRTTRHVAVHGGSAGAVSAAAGVLHVFGPTGLGLGVAGVAAAGAGVVAARKRLKGSRSSVRRASVVRTMRRSTRTAAGRRSGAAGLGRARGSVGATGRSRATSARRAAGSGRAAGVGRTGRHAGASAARGGALRHRRGKPSVLGPGTATRRSGGGHADSRAGRAGTRAGRRLTRTARSSGAARTRPAGKHPAPVTRAGKARAAASRRARHTARFARRRSVRIWGAIKSGNRAGRNYLRFKPPATEATPEQKQELVYAVAARDAKKRAAAKKKAATGLKNAASKPVPTRKNPTRPGRAIAAPGLTVKDIMDANAPTAGITAVSDAIREHIAAFEPENALEIGGFLAGLDNLFNELGSGLITAADKLGGDHPVDQSVVDHLHQLGAHAITLADWGTQTHALFRAAHESEINRLENPRAREEDWDVERNR